jgi:hypothetical protein
VNAKDIVILVCEKKSPAPYWSHAHGIYADLSHWPKSIDYYVKCPECGNVHGTYKNWSEARINRLCDTCQFEKVEKAKKELAKLGEAEIPIPPDQPNEPNPDQPIDPDAPYDIKSEVTRYMQGDWVTLAKWQLEQAVGEKLEFDPEHWSNRDVDYEDPDSFNKVTFKVEDTNDLTYTVWKDESDAIADAERQCQQSFEDEPGTYMQWLRNYIDMDKARDALLPDEESMTRERFDEDYTDYESQVAFMLEQGKIPEETFYTPTGKLRKETSARQHLLSQAIDEWVTEVSTERVSDPEEYLKELGYEETSHRDPYSGRESESLGDMLIRLGGIDFEKAAKEAIAADGWQHELARHDGHSIDLPCGAVAVRD